VSRVPRFGAFRYSVAPKLVSLVYLGLYRREPLFPWIYWTFCRELFLKVEVLPIRPAEFAGTRKILPCAHTKAAILAGPYLPSARKIDV